MAKLSTVGLAKFSKLNDTDSGKEASIGGLAKARG